MEFLGFFCFLCLLHYANLALSLEEQTKIKTYYMTRDCRLPTKPSSYMEKNQRELTVPLGGAVIYSHREGEERFPVNFVCMIVAHAAEGRRIHINIRNLYIPTKSDVCTNALYLYDSNTFLTKGMSAAGGDSGMCNRVKPKTLTTSTSYLTIVLRTDDTICKDCASELRPGVKLILTSVQEPKKDAGSPNGRVCRSPSDFMCGGVEDNFCIPASLKCDGVPNCKDASDEKRSLAKCGKRDNTLFGKIFSLGVSAAIAIVAGPILCFIICLAATICCCFRCSRARQKSTAASAAASLPTRSPQSVSTGHNSAPGSAAGDSVYVGGGFMPMRTVSSGSERQDGSYAAPGSGHKYYPVNGHYSASSGGTASPYNYKKNTAPSLASSGYQALVYSSKSFSAASGGGGGPGPVPDSGLGQPHPAAPGGYLPGGYPSSVYSYQSSHSSAALAQPSTYRDSLLSGRLHSPTSSRSGRSLRSSVTYHAYNPTPSLANTEERIEYPVQL